MPELEQEKNLNQLPNSIKWAIKVAKPLFAFFAVPVRAMFDIVQNSTVTSALTKCIFALVIVTGVSRFHGTHLNDAWDSYTRYMNERAKTITRVNNAAHPEAELGVFSTLVANQVRDATAGTTGILVTFSPVKGATFYEMPWQINLGTSGAERVAAADVTLATDGFIHHYIDSTDFTVSSKVVWPTTGNGRINIYVTAGNDFHKVHSSKRVSVEVNQNP